MSQFRFMIDRRESLARAVFLLAITFLAAVCSLGYELLMASRLSRAFQEGVFLYPLVVAVFVLFLGAGAVRAARFSALHQKEVFARLCRVEMVLAVIGALAMGWVQLFLIDSLWGVNLEALAAGLIIAAGIGYMSGQELPLLWRFAESIDDRPSLIRGMILADYAASLIATLLCLWVFIGRWGFLRSGWILGGLNGLLWGLLIAWGERRGFIRLSKTKIAAALGVFFVWTAVLLGMDRIERFFLWREFFYHPAVSLVHYEYTPYQQVVVFVAHKDLNRPVPQPWERVFDQPDQYRVLAVLNGSLQFDEPLSGADDFDHHALFAPFYAFRPDINEVLILGGGDGLPAKAALSLMPQARITVVDIDGQWVDLARTHPILRRVNGEALSDPRVSLITADAFQWIRTSPQRFDLIAVDFPAEPRSLAKIRTYSLEFFRDLVRLRKPQSIVVIHSNEIFLPWIRGVIARTAFKAGWFPVWGAFVSNEEELGQLVLFATARQAQRFVTFYRARFRAQSHQEDYRRLSHSMENQDLFDKSSSCVVSFYDPFLSCLSWGRKKELLRMFWGG